LYAKDKDSFVTVFLFIVQYNWNCIWRQDGLPFYLLYSF